MYPKTAKHYHPRPSPLLNDEFSHHFHSEHLQIHRQPKIIQMMRHLTVAASLVHIYFICGPPPVIRIIKTTPSLNYASINVLIWTLTMVLIPQHPVAVSQVGGSLCSTWTGLDDELWQTMLQIAVAKIAAFLF